MYAPSEPQKSPESSDSVAESLFEVMSGAAVIVARTLTEIELLLASRGLFTRTYLPNEYGLFSMTFTVVSILTVLASLGLQSGIVR